MPIHRINIYDVKEILGYTDIRSVEHWCDDNDVIIITDRGRRYISKSEFEYAMDKPFIMALKEKHKEKWEDIYDIYQQNNKLLFVDTRIGKYKNKSLNRNCYKPQSKMAIAFLEKIK